MLAGQSINHLLDLGGDDIVAGETLNLKDMADYPLGHQMLNQHLIHCLLADVGIERRPTKRHKFGKLIFEFPIVLMGFLDLGFECGSDMGDFLFVGINRLLKIVE